ncbi:MAG: DUF29 domain-containing protein [Thermodesulfobacteriota bacterium]|nr:DUF29 domain-containing protein [Thermodesulfobacteriota bacterium]
MQESYEKDFYFWTQQQAEVLKKGLINELDFEHLAEEIESMGKSEKRELISRMAILLAHLLKWQFQLGNRSNSWKYTIKEQRISVHELLEDSPSLKSEIKQRFNYAYNKARLKAAKETGLEEESFPEISPFTLEQTLDRDFWPAT